MPSPNLRAISRDKLFQVFKTEELVRLIEEILYTLNVALPGNTSAIEEALAAHIADTADAHEASAIGATPGGSRTANTVQGQLGEIDEGKASTAALTEATAEVQAYAIQRSNHTGTQPATTVSDFGVAADLRVRYFAQGATISKDGDATLTIAELLTGIIEYTGAAASLTLPTGADIDAGPSMAVDRAFEFCLINTGSDAATLGASAGLTLAGTMTITAGTSARLRVRKTAAGTYTVYRVA